MEVLTGLLGFILLTGNTCIIAVLVIALFWILLSELLKNKRD
jgi:hypothetical protein